VKTPFTTGTEGCNHARTQTLTKQHFPLTPHHSKYLGHFVLKLNTSTTVALAVCR